MYKLVESIRVIDGVIVNLSLHQQRLERSYKTLYNLDCPWVLSDIFASKKTPPMGLFKLRFVCNRDKYEFAYQPYKVADIRTLKVVCDDSIDYSIKLIDRTAIDNLFSQRQNCDDILIVKNDLISDSSYCNLIFSRNGKWYTPKQPLLAGTYRQFLISNKLVTPIDIGLKDLANFDSFKLINAMRPIEEIEPQPIKNIVD